MKRILSLLTALLLLALSTGAFAAGPDWENPTPRCTAIGDGALTDGYAINTVSLGLGAEEFFFAFREEHTAAELGNYVGYEFEFYPEEMFPEGGTVLTFERKDNEVTVLYDFVGEEGIEEDVVTLPAEETVYVFFPMRLPVTEDCVYWADIWMAGDNESPVEIGEAAFREHLEMYAESTEYVNLWIRSGEIAGMMLAYTP
ncbi:MAG: hypothetical protein Q4C53_05765 [Clostridia bacterium]|nr:hypothetical protein [Clostridia bacterium]